MITRQLRLVHFNWDGGAPFHIKPRENAKTVMTFQGGAGEEGTASDLQLSMAMGEFLRLLEGMKLFKGKNAIFIEDADIKIVPVKP